MLKVLARQIVLLSTVLFLLVLFPQSSGAASEHDSESEDAYLMAYFRSGPGQTDMKRQLHYAYSRDGMHWYELNNNNYIWKPLVGGQIVRDPFLNKGPDGTWHLVYTTGGGQVGIGHASSTDLISWGSGEIIPVMQNYSGAVNAWAPEWTYDDTIGQYRLYWASTLNRPSADRNKHYTATTADWTTFSNASLWFDPGIISAIDANIAQYNGTYYMYYKDDTYTYDSDPNTYAATKQASSGSLAGSYSNISGYLTPPQTEAPEVFKDLREDKHYMIYDYWAQGKYGIKQTTNITDPSAWSSELSASSVRFPYQTRHASVTKLKESELWSLLDRYSLEAHYKFEETSGTSAADASVNGHTATVFGGAAWTAGGLAGRGLELDGVDDYVELADNSSSTGFMHDAFKLRSVSMWFKADATGGNKVLYEEGGNVSGFGVKIENGVLKAAVREGSSQTTVSTAFTDTSSWHHTAAVFNEGKLSLYLDGKLVQTVTASYTSIGAHGDSAAVGRRSGLDAFGGSGSGDYFDGKVDDIRIFTVPLQPEDVSYLVTSAGLQAYYKLDETSGSAAADNTINHHSVTVAGGAAWTATGRVGGALQFDGIDDYAELADNSSSTGFMHDPFQMRSVSMWVRPVSTNGTQVLYDEGGSTSGLSVMIENGSLKAAVRAGSAPTTVSANFSDAASSWHHIAVVFDMGSLSLYLDGILQQSATASFNTVSAHGDSAALGRRSDSDALGVSGSGAYFAGKIDEFRVYAVPLQLADVLNLNRYNHLQAYYRLGETSGTKAADASGSGNPGKLYGGAAWTSSGKIGGALDLDGADDYVFLADNHTVSGFMHNAFNKRSVTMWIKADATNGTNVLYDQGGSASGMAIRIENGNLKAAVRENSVQTTVTTPLTDTASWHHVAVVFNEGVISLYLDGQLKQSSTASYSRVSMHPDFGALGRRSGLDAFGGSGSGDYFNGKIDEVRIYNIPLEAGDISYLASGH